MGIHDILWPDSDVLNAGTGTVENEYLAQIMGETEQKDCPDHGALCNSYYILVLLNS